MHIIGMYRSDSWSALTLALLLLRCYIFMTMTGVIIATIQKLPVTVHEHVTKLSVTLSYPSGDTV